MTNPKKDRVAAVTGATGAIGKAIASKLAKLNYRVVLITRNPDKSNQAVREIIADTNNQSVEYKIADLSRKSSIKSLADNWKGPLHVLINNAAVTPQTRQVTQDGIEQQFATNVLGYFWMTRFFTKILAASSPARIVNVASYWAGGLDLTDLEFERRSYHNHDAYRQSKQANRMLTPLFSDELAGKVITVNSCHPGDVNSNLSNKLGFGGSQTPAQGAQTPVWLATSKSLEGVTGKYFEHQKEVPCRFGSQREDAQKLYKLCLAY